MKTSVYIATSLDRFIARQDGSIDWLSAGDDPGDQDYGYQDFIRSVDALVMGRGTYETVLSFGAWPYGNLPVFVLSSQPVEIPDSITDTVSVMSAPPGEVVQQLARRGYQHLYIDGGRTIQGFLSGGLIDQLIITRVPVLIGGGIPLFGALPGDIRLEHLGTRQFESGLVQSSYRVIKDQL
jgi:dihydrofolate reductase